MNKTLIAAAVSAAVAAPVASADITVYGRVNNAIDLNDLSAAPNSESTTHLSTVASRFGLKGSTDLGNGLTVHGQYEFSTDSDKETGPKDVRIATAGVSGSFGRLDVGNQWSAYQKTVGTLISPTYTLGGPLYSAVGGGAFRASNTIQYSNSWGPVGAVLDIRLNDEADDGAGSGADYEGDGVAETLRGDGWGLGVTYQVTPSVKLTAAYDVEDRAPTSGVTSGVFTAQTTAGDDILATLTETTGTISADQTRLGIAGTWNIGSSGYWVSAGWQKFEKDNNVDTVYTAVAGAIDADDDGNGTDASLAAAANDFNGVDMFDETEAHRFTTAGAEDVSTYFVYGGGPIGQKTSWLLGYASGDNGLEATREYSELGTSPLVATDDANQLVWGLYHNVGGGLRFYYEAISLEHDVRDNTKDRDGERHLLGIRVDF